MRGHTFHSDTGPDSGEGEDLAVNLPRPHIQTVSTTTFIGRPLPADQTSGDALIGVAALYSDPSAPTGPAAGAITTPRRLRLGGE